MSQMRIERLVSCLLLPLLCTAPAEGTPQGTLEKSLVFMDFGRKKPRPRETASISLRTSLLKIVLPTDLERRNSRVTTMSTCGINILHYWLNREIYALDTRDMVRKIDVV